MVSCLNDTNTSFFKDMPLPHNCACPPNKRMSTLLNPLNLDVITDFLWCPACHDVSRSLKILCETGFLPSCFYHGQEKDVPGLAYCSKGRDGRHGAEMSVPIQAPSGAASLMTALTCLSEPHQDQQRYRRNQRLFSYATWLFNESHIKSHGGKSQGTICQVTVRRVCNNTKQLELTGCRCQAHPGNGINCLKGFFCIS